LPTQLIVVKRIHKEGYASEVEVFLASNLFCFIEEDTISVVPENGKDCIIQYTYSKEVPYHG
jgi:hypothetical protein